MADSKQIAGLIGPVLMAVTVSEAKNLSIWTNNPAPVVYLNGALLFVAGLSILRAHNRWCAGWPVIVTLTGWISVLGGLYRMFFPEAQQAGPSGISYAALAVLFVLGGSLTFIAYRREKCQTRRQS